MAAISATFRHRLAFRQEVAVKSSSCLLSACRAITQSCSHLHKHF